MQLPLIQRLKLLRQRAYSAFNIGEHKLVTIAPTENGVVIGVEGRRIFAPSPLRWKLYKYGWNARLDQLAREYGVDRYASLTADSVVLDVGANGGEFAHVCARYGAAIHCFEPDPLVHACLVENIKTLPKAAAYDEVLWNEASEVDFGLAPDRADSSVFTQGAPTIKKKTRTINDFCREKTIRKIDLIKCDAEGAEPEVLEGVGDFFPNVRVVALDTGAERNGLRTHERCAQLLSENGFSVTEEKIGTRWMTYGVNRAHE